MNKKKFKPEKSLIKIMGNEIKKILFFYETKENKIKVSQKQFIKTLALIASILAAFSKLLFYNNNVIAIVFFLCVSFIVLYPFSIVFEIEKKSKNNNRLIKEKGVAKLKLGKNFQKF